jgi:hypothetical protein
MKDLQSMKLGGKKNNRAEEKKKFSNCMFRSCDLRVMSPAPILRLVFFGRSQFLIVGTHASAAPNCFVE